MGRHESAEVGKREREVYKQEREVHKRKQAREEQAYCALLLELKERHIARLEQMVAAQEWQAGMVGQTVGTMKEDRWVILALAASFVLPIAYYPASGPSPTCCLAATCCPAMGLGPRPVGLGGGPEPDAVARAPCPCS